jgi:4-alpha-glucanotransferase
MQNEFHDSSNSIEPVMNTPEPLDTERLDHLLDLSGIASEFIEFSGDHARIPVESRMHVLHAMGIEVNSPEELEQAIMARELATLHNWLTPVTLSDAETGQLVLSIESGQEAGFMQWTLKLESGATSHGEFDPAGLETLSSHMVGGHHFLRKLYRLDALPTGYHEFELKRGNVMVSSLLVVPPKQTWQPPFLTEGSRGWGLSAQLYTIRTAQNWGIGDFADLAELVRFAARGGADFILLNPLHSLDLCYPENASPYSPGDRRFLNPLYIALPLCEEFSSEPVQAVFKSREFQQDLATARAAGNVDYALVCKLKLRMLGLMFTVFQDRRGTRTRDFNAWLQQQGQGLLDFAAFEAKRLNAAGEAAGDARFQLYLQWLASTQMQDCQAGALEAGMQIGLVRDLAVGSRSDGSEVGENPGLFCLQARIGAPPDYFNPEGQNWGLPPLHPMALENNRFAHFISLLRSNMRDCGALRIDHVMALMRLWWCPMDGTNATGAYVHYPVEMLFALLRLESTRNRCAVIGEDLGVVPPEIRQYLDEGGIYSNCVFYFEKYDGWHFRKPEHYKLQALAMIANHDTATLKAWWNCSDLVLRRKIGLIPTDGNLANDMNWRNGEKGQLLVWLQEQDLLPSQWQVDDPGQPFDENLLHALVSACARIASRLVSLQLDDLAGAEDPVNIPGTSTEYANWRRRLPVALDDIFSRPETARLLKAVSDTRKT